MNNGHIYKKPYEANMNKIITKNKSTAMPIISKPGSVTSVNNNMKKEDDCLIIKDKSPIMFNRSKNNFYSKESQSNQKSNFGKFNSSANQKNNIITLSNNNVKNINNKEITQENKLENLNSLGNPNLNSNIVKNGNIKSILSNSLKSPTNIQLDSENLFKKNFISQQNVSGNEKVNNFIINQESLIIDTLKREMDFLKTELSMANLKIKEKDKRIDLLENQLINQKEENKTLKNENAELKKKLEEKRNLNVNNAHEVENDEFPAFYRRRNLLMFNDMLEDFMRQIHGGSGNINENNDALIEQLYPNPDNMTYEQLLELQEKIGYVSKGLSEDEKKKIPVKTFNKRNNNINLNTNCTICLMDFENNEKLKSIKCGHQFHNECLDGWLNNEKVCPICKNEVI